MGPFFSFCAVDGWTQIINTAQSIRMLCYASDRQLKTMSFFVYPLQVASALFTEFSFFVHTIFDKR